MILDEDNTNIQNEVCVTSQKKKKKDNYKNIDYKDWLWHFL